MSSTTSAVASASTTAVEGSGQSDSGISVLSFFSALASGLVIFGVQLLGFLIIRNKLARIYIPKTYLVPEKERTRPPKLVWYGWMVDLFKISDNDIISKCGLDAYFFLRYLFTLLKIFIPLACVIWPILLPLNYIDGIHYQLQHKTNTTQVDDVTGLDTLAWSNVAPNHTSRYWAHLLLAILVVLWVCFIFFNELRGYIRVRQAYLTSPQHRLKASATTVLVTSIPKKWMTVEALDGLYDVFPGGIRNIWINRNFDELSEKVQNANKAALELEAAETELVRKAKKAHEEKEKKAKKKARKEAGAKKQTKHELAEEQARKTAQAQAAAAGDGGVSSGDRHEVRHTIDEALDEEDEANKTPEPDHAHHEDTNLFGGIGKGFNFMAEGMGRGIGGIGHGLGAVGTGFGRAGRNIVGGVHHFGEEVDGTIETTNGFQAIETPPRPSNVESVRGDPVLSRYRSETPEQEPNGQYPNMHRGLSTRLNHPAYRAQAPRAYLPSQGKSQFERTPTTVEEAAKKKSEQDPTTFVSSTGLDGAAATKKSDWWKFWQAPNGAFPSPLPTGYEEESFPFAHDSSNNDNDGPKGHKRKTSEIIKDIIPFLSNEEMTPLDYPDAFNKDFDIETCKEAKWQLYLEAKDRPTLRLRLFSWTPDWLPGVGWLGLGKKVDAIYYWRKELATLNVQIETEQKNPDRFPLMNSAFIQFNHQVAAHMACQAVSHHVPKQMAPRTIEISPNDVLWDNMSIKWWEGWLRTGVVFSLVAGMVILWAFPVTWTASLSQIDVLIAKYKWLNFLTAIPANLIQVLQGILPAAVLALLLALVPVILRLLAKQQGNQTGVSAELSVQNYYFSFLFVQVFLVVSIASSIFTVLSNLSDVVSVPNTLATNLPKASNYFFSYMLLQALSTSAGALLQVMTLIKWYVCPKLFDNTAREKWTRNTQLPSVKWGSFFPVYTNFACIALVYSVVSPLILLFAIITFALFWVAYRYNTLFVSRFVIDTGGLLFPRAINQTFTGLYVMELCLIGLFFLVRDEDGAAACTPQAIIMVIVAIFTVLYQFLLNQAFGPLFRYLPITLEDDAVRRDKDFERLQAKRLGLDHYSDNDESSDTEGPSPTERHVNHTHSMDRAQYDGPNESIELQSIERASRIDLTQHQDHGAGRGATIKRIADPRNIKVGGKSWATRDHAKRSKNFGHYPAPGRPNLPHRHSHPSRTRADVEAQKQLDTIGNALFGNMADEIEDLTPDERDLLVQRAFQHTALRAPRPAVWIPRDELGVSDGEIRETNAYSSEIWVTNEGTALDGKSRVVYGRNPPDFSEVDLIQL